MHINLTDSRGDRSIFEPIDSKRVTMYCCGPTVYDVPHIGNARSAVVFDVLFRMLRHVYGEDHVVFAKNFTDIDDKIIDRANELGISIGDLTDTTIADYRFAMNALNVLEPTIAPRATEHIQQMSRMIEHLVSLAAAYVANGYVYFAVKNSMNQTELLQEVERQIGARIAVDTNKDDPRDFVLWKPAKHGEPAYQGPFSIMGRPGWHIECSSMISDTLGETIDIHAGGNDLVFPHHQCEIMQSETINRVPLANWWLHNGMLTVDGQKMSKSAGNFITVPEVLERVPGEVLRYFLLSGHYRQPLDFTWDKLNESKIALDRLYRALGTVWDADELEPYRVSDARINSVAYDINTPDALATLHADAAEAFIGGNPSATRTNMLSAGNLLGLLQSTPDEWFRSGSVDVVEIERLIEARKEKRKVRDFAQADAIREQLRDMGVVLEDTSAGTNWQTL